MMRTIRAILFFCLLSLTGSLCVAAPAVQDLQDVGLLREWFQRSVGNVRVLALLSPTCASCIQGFTNLQKILQSAPDPRVQVAVVWMPVGPGDNRKLAVSQSALFTDGRMTYFWDPYRASGETWQSVLKLKGAAWDVYLVYDSKATWNAPDLDPGVPAFWMHQLKDVPQGPQLNPATLEQKIRALIPK